MSMKIKELVKLLSKKDQEQEVELVIVSIDGIVVCMDIESKAADLAKLLKVFNGGIDG